MEKQSFEGTTASSHIASPYEAAVTPPTTTPATVFVVTDPPYQQLQQQQFQQLPQQQQFPQQQLPQHQQQFQQQQQEPKQVANIALGQLFNGAYVSPAVAPTPRPFEPLYEPEVPAADSYQLPTSSATAASASVQTNYNVQVSIF